MREPPPPEKPEILISIQSKKVEIGLSRMFGREVFSKDLMFFIDLFQTKKSQLANILKTEPYIQRVHRYGTVLVAVSDKNMILEAKVFGGFDIPKAQEFRSQTLHKVLTLVESDFTVLFI